jgi:hypothetical protein
MNIKERVAELLATKGDGTQFMVTRAELEDIALVMGVGRYGADPLRDARARKANDCRYITAEDALLEALQMVRDTPPDRDARIVICWHTFEKANPDGPVRPYRRSAGLTMSRMIATLFAEATDCATEWNTK